MRPSLQRHRDSWIALGGGLALALATPPTDLYPLAFVGLGAYAALIARAESSRRGFLLGWLWATAAHLFGLRFVPSVIMRFTPLGLGAALAAHALLSAAQSLAWGAGAALGVALRKRLGAPIELGAAAATLLAVSLPALFFWTPAGLLSPWPALLQTADAIGERGLSALFAALAAAGVRSLLRLRADRRRADRRRAWLPGAGAAAGIALIAAHGAYTMGRFARASQPAAGGARLALVWAAVDPRDRWAPRNHPRILAELRRQTAIAETAGVDLTIWPEAAYPFPLAHDVAQMPVGRRAIISGNVQGPVLFGYLASARPYRDRADWVRDEYNAASIVRRDNTLSPSYDKMQLLWFGEMVPLGQQIPWLRRTFARGGGIIPGKALRRLDQERGARPALKMGVLNCYEDTLPDVARLEMRELSPNLLVNLTNDAWFMRTAEPLLHLRLSALRAIELRRDLVRAVNLGFAGWIDASGRVRAQSLGQEPGYLVVTPALRDGITSYAVTGDWPAWGLVALCVAASWLRQRRSAG